MGRSAHPAEHKFQAARAEALVQMGELSPARQVLEGAFVVPGNEETRAALQNLERRPPCLRDPIPPDILNAAPVKPLVLDAEDFARNVCSTKRGAAGDPCGMTANHLLLILESELDTRAFCWAAQDLARAQVPPDVVAVFRITALQKPGGGVRGCVRKHRAKVVARTIAQDHARRFGSNVSVPVRVGFKGGRRVCCTCNNSFTTVDTRATVLSIDGVFVFDLISRAVMLDGMVQIRGGEAMLPFCSFILSFHSTFRLTSTGTTMSFSGGEGGERGRGEQGVLIGRSWGFARGAKFFEAT